MSLQIVNRERRLRRKLAQLGFRLHKTPARSWLRAYYGSGFMVTDNNTVVFGCFQREYDVSIEDVEEWADELPRLA